MGTMNYDAAIIGGGVIGCAVAREFSDFQKNGPLVICYEDSDVTRLPDQEAGAHVTFTIFQLPGVYGKGGQRCLEV